MRSASALVHAVLGAALVLAGCGASQGEDPSPHPEVTAGDAGVRLVDEEEANFVLHASNQSFDDEEVRLAIAVDGVPVVDDDFHVEDQHNWVTFPLRLTPGTHEIVATSDSGAELRESFEVPLGQVRYAAIDHWGEDSTAELSWSVQRRPMAFA